MQHDSHDPIYTRTWDTLGRPKTILNALGTSTSGYAATNLFARPDTLTQPNTLVSSYTYLPNTAPGDSAQRLASITHKRGTAANTATHRYTCGSAGLISS